MGRSGAAPDEVGGLLQAAGCGDVDAFAALYDRTASVVFGLLQHTPGDSAAAERAMVRVYVRVWRTAPAFDPAVMSGGAFLIEAVHREFDGRERRDHARCVRTPRATPDRHRGPGRPRP
jgi:RNA polymerase sigma-70 factor, ECF subfamily